MKSNETLLSARQNIISEFKKYEYIIVPFIKFIFIFTGIYMLKGVTNYTGALGGMLAIMLLSLIGAFASAEWILIGSILVTTFFILPANPVFAILIFIILTIIYLAFMRLFPKESLLCLVTLVAFSLNMPLLIPIIAGLVMNYVSVAAMIIGVILWFLVPELMGVIQSPTLNKTEIVDLVTSISKIDFNALLLDPKMLSIIVVFFIVFSVVYIIRKQSIDYGPYIAICVGLVVNILGFGMAVLFFNDIGMGIVSVIIWTLISGVLAVIIQFFSLALDYQRAEVVQFEDEENYYYVKVIPKINATVKHSRVKHVYTNNKGTKDFNSRIMESYHEDRGI